jgi:hypothetical protein
MMGGRIIWYWRIIGCRIIGYRRMIGCRIIENWPMIVCQVIGYWRMIVCWIIGSFSLLRFWVQIPQRKLILLCDQLLLFYAPLLTLVTNLCLEDHYWISHECSSLLPYLCTLSARTRTHTFPVPWAEQWSVFLWPDVWPDTPNFNFCQFLLI